jgi:hypothetical protein
LELLNTICLAESRAGIYLNAWADQTATPESKACLVRVAARETSHYEVFKRRIEELARLTPGVRRPVKPPEARPI